MSLHDSHRIVERLQSVADPVGFLTNLFAHAPVGFAVWSADGTALLTNAAFMSIFGVEPPPGYNVLHDDVLAASGMLPLFQRAFAGEAVHVPTFWFDPRESKNTPVEDGRRVAISMTIFPLFKASGEIEYVAATYKDETEIMLTAERLRRSEERLHVLAECSREFASTTVISTLLDLVARRLCEIVGEGSAIRLLVRDGTAFDPSVTTTYHPDPSIMEAARTLAADEPLRLGEGMTGRVALSGEAMLVPVLTLAQLLASTPPKYHPLMERLGVTSLLAVPLRARGRVIGVITMSRRDPSRPYTKDDQELMQDLADRAAMAIESAMLFAELEDRVAELQQANDALLRSRARKAAVMEAALDAIVLMDDEGRIIDWNPAAERTFGHARADVLGRLLADTIVPPSLRAAHSDGLRRYLASGEARVLGKRIEVSAVRKDGVELPAEVAVVRIQSEGAPVFTGYIRDITERRRAAEAEILQREKDAIEEANRELEAFSYSVAHDLRAPLRGISGFTSAFLEDHGAGLDPAGTVQLRRVISSAGRMGEIIDGLLSLAQLSRAELRHEDVDVTAMSRAIVEQLRAVEPARSVELAIDDGIVAHGDPRLLRVVLENLLANAWKFTRRRDAARIEVGAEAAPDGVCYRVRDNGAGFDMTYVDKLFGPFQRLHTANQFEGNGVGLATVHRIVRRHGGTVAAMSVENEGATFSFTLPRSR